MLEILICSIIVFVFLCATAVLAWVVPLNNQEKLEQSTAIIETDSVLVKLANASKSGNIPSVVESIR